MNIFNWIKKKRYPRPEPNPPPPAPTEKPLWQRLAERENMSAWDKPKIDRDGILRKNFKITNVPITYAQGVAMDSDNPSTVAMDSSIGSFDDQSAAIPDPVLEWFGKHSFIGFNACALLKQQWIIDNACTIPADDAMAPDFVLGYSENNKTKSQKDDDGASEQVLVDIKNAACEDYVIGQLCRRFTSNKKTFGIGLAFPEMSDDVDMSLPYNPDGIKKGQYKGMVIVEPYWCAPQLDSASATDPASMGFYEPTWWNVRGKQVHNSWCVKVVNTILPDILKPTYYYGGVPLPQMIYERVYASEKCANEAPSLLLTKRMLVADADVDNLVANPDAANCIINALSYMRDNFATWFKNQGDQVMQVDTGLADVDTVIMSQYQIVAAIAQMPATKLLKTTPKGFNATGEHEEKDYKQSLVAIQEHDFVPLIKRHLELYTRSELGKDLPITVTFNPIDTPTEEEAAAVEEAYSRVYSGYVNSGIIDPIEVRDILRNDEGGRFSTLPELSADDLDADAERLADEVEKDEADSVTKEKKETRDAMDAKEFKEADHPRDDDGKFGSSGGGAGGKKKEEKKDKSKTMSVKYDGKKWVSSEGKVPDHIAKVKIPPKWTGVTVSLDPNANVLASGKDSQGRSQSVYSDAFTQASSDKKFAKIEALRSEMPTITKNNEKGLKSDNPKEKEAAQIFSLIQSMGIRPGGDSDTKAKKQAYGATTLQARHVVKKSDGVYLMFTGKKGVDLDLKVESQKIGKMLLEKTAGKGDNDKIFGTNSRALIKYSKSISDGKVRPKDLRTYLGTETARDLIGKYDKPKTKEEYKKIVKEVAKTVSDKLGNTPSVALQSYINPAVFLPIKV